MGAILQYGLSVALVGMSTVFVGLIILIGLIKLMEMIMTGGRRRPKRPLPLLLPPLWRKKPSRRRTTTS